MNPSKICNALQIVVMIVIRINSVHTDQSDVDRCNGQIEYAFKGATTALGCLKYALEYYVQNEIISIPLKEKTVSGSKPVQVKSFSELVSHNNTNRVVPKKATSKPVQVNSFSELVSHNNTRRVVPKKATSKPVQVKSFSELVSHNNTRRVVPKKATSSPLKVNSFKELLSTAEQTGQNFSNESASSTSATQNVSNYAKKYYDKLEHMIDSAEVPRIRDFCRQIFRQNYFECYVDLLPFGGFANRAVKAALFNYKLELVSKNSYVYAYLICIINLCNIRKDSKSPSEFCDEFKE